MFKNKDRNGMAVAGLVCSLIGIGTCGIMSIVGVVLSAIGIKKANDTGDRLGIAVAGLIVGIIGTILTIIVSIITTVAIFNADFEDDYISDSSDSSYTDDYSGGYTYYYCDISFRDSEDNLLMDKEVLKNRPAKLTKDANGNPAIQLTIKDKDKFYNVTEELSKKTDRTLIIWSNFDEYMDHFETEKDNCGKEDSHCLIYATVSQGFSSDVIIQGNYTEEEAKDIIDCINNSNY